jgi:hypothetical protein
MTNRNCSTVVAAALLASIAGAALAADLDPTGQAGQYATDVTPVRLKGTGGDFAATRVWVPFIIRNDITSGAGSVNSLINAALAQFIAGQPYGAISTFSATGQTPGTNAPRVVAMLAPTDAGSPLSSGTSVNTVVDEGSRNLSNSLGELLPDGTLAFLERFGGGTSGPTGQNNLGWVNSAHTAGPVAAIQAPAKAIVNTTVNVGNAGETAINPTTATTLGGVFLGVPSIARDPNNNNVVLTAGTTFNGSPSLTASQRAAATSGVIVFDGTDNDPGTVNGPSFAATCNSVFPYTPGAGVLSYWLQAGAPLPTTPAGECFADVRQTKPLLEVVRTPGGNSIVYQVHGIGFSGGTPFTGGSARPLYLAVDSVYAPGSTTTGRTGYTGSNATKSFNTIIIEGDAAGGEGTLHGLPYDNVAPANAGFANHFVTDPSKKFVDSQATGGGAGPSTTTQFDMNASGQIVALWVDEGTSPARYEVRRYDPVWDLANDRIEGYTLGKVVTFNGDVDNNSNVIVLPEVRTTIIDTLGTTFIETSIAPFSGVAIDDNGLITFAGIREKFDRLLDLDGIPQTPATIYLDNTTNALFVYEPTTDTLHEIIQGGQNGDVLVDAFPATSTNESLALGFFPVEAASDGIARGSISATGGIIAANFRSGGNERLNGANVELETLPDGSADTFDDNGGVLVTPTNGNERSVRGTTLIRLGQFVRVPTCCPGDADSSGSVNFTDITVVLANFGSTGTPGQQNAGDADCSGAINFTDITTVLANFGSNCN